jgi:hypothetical protein
MDDALEVFEILVHDMFSKAKKDDQRARLRTLKDLDVAATTLADRTCGFVQRPYLSIPLIL